MMLQGWLDVSVNACIRYADEAALKLVLLLLQTTRTVTVAHMHLLRVAALSASRQVISDILKVVNAATMACLSSGMLATMIYRYLGVRS